MLQMSCQRLHKRPSASAHSNDKRLYDVRYVHYFVHTHLSARFALFSAGGRKKNKYNTYEKQAYE